MSSSSGTSLRAIVNTPTYDCSDYENVPLIDATATQDDDGNVTIFCVNRDMNEDFTLDVDLRDFGGMQIREHILLKHRDVKAVNTEENPDTVSPVNGDKPEADSGRMTVALPALSWNVIRLAKE